MLLTLPQRAVLATQRISAKELAPTTNNTNRALNSASDWKERTENTPNQATVPIMRWTAMRARRSRARW